MRLDPRVFVILAVQAYRYVLFVRILLSWLLPMVTVPDALRPAMSFLHDVTEPFLRIFRRLLPAVRLGGAAFDLSPVLGFLALTILESALTRALFQLPG